MKKDIHVYIFSKFDTDIGECNLIKHRTHLVDDTPYKQCHRKIPPSVTDEVRIYLVDLLAGRMIKKSKSSWVSKVVLVRKKNGQLRICVD